MAIVSQEPVLFASSIKENIQYGVEEEMDMTSVERVAKMANIHDFISSLPMVSLKTKEKEIRALLHKS